MFLPCFTASWLSPLLIFLSSSSPWADFTRASPRNMRKHFSSEGCHPNVSVTESFWCAEVFYCWNILLMLFEWCSPNAAASLHFFNNRTKMLWLIYFFFLLPWSPIQSWGKIVLCFCEAFEMAGKTSESTSSGEQFVTVHPLHTSVEVWDDPQSYYPLKSCLTYEVIDYILREEDKRKMSHWDSCDF